MKICLWIHWNTSLRKWIRISIGGSRMTTEKMKELLSAKDEKNLVTGEKWSSGLGSAMVGGALSGALAATGVGLLGQMAGNAVIGAGQELWNQATDDEEGIDWGYVGLSGAATGLCAYFGGPGSKGAMNDVGSQLKSKVFKRVGNLFKANAKASVKKGTGQLIKESFSIVKGAFAKKTKDVIGGTARKMIATNVKSLAKSFGFPAIPNTATNIVKNIRAKIVEQTAR